MSSDTMDILFEPLPGLRFVGASCLGSDNPIDGLSSVSWNGCIAFLQVMWSVMQEETAELMALPDDSAPKVVRPYPPSSTSH